MFFENERDLKKYVYENSDEIFGKPIRWRSDTNLPGENRSIRADLIGDDADANTVIVEVKRLGAAEANQYDKPRAAIGQILHYATAYVQHHLKGDNLYDFSNKEVRDAVKNVRLFIVTPELHYSIVKMCDFLEAYGITISYIALNNL